MIPLRVVTVGAAAIERRMREQEEAMHYSADDLEKDWEFKIVRGHIGAFRSPAALQKLVDQESLAGWTMLEKFDDSRVRFKRPATAREQDHLLSPGIDPYRTDLTSSVVWLALVLVIGLICGLACVLLLWLPLR
jgi:hypothetical protein